MKVILNKQRDDEYKITALERLAKGIHRASTPSGMWVILDGTDEYKKYGEDSIFYTFQMEGKVFHVALD